MDDSNRYQQTDGLKIVARAIDEALEEIYNRKMGFSLITWPMIAENEEEQADYIGNCVREDMIKFLRITADRLEKRKDFVETEAH